MFIYVLIHTNTYVQAYEVEERGMKNQTNCLVPKRWEMAMPIIGRTWMGFLRGKPQYAF